MQSDKPAPREFLRGLFMAEESLEIGGGELDEGLSDCNTCLNSIWESMSSR